MREIEPGLADGSATWSIELDRSRAIDEAINEARLRVWQQQPAAFFEEAIIDRLTFIELAKRAGFTVAEIRKLQSGRMISSCTAESAKRHAIGSVSMRSLLRSESWRQIKRC